MSARAERGFTLLELMVVLAIISAMAVAFPLALNRFVPARRVDATARELVADLRLAQARSIASNRPVSIEVAANGYRIDSELRELRASTTLELRSGDGHRELIRLRLFPDGSSTGGHFLIRDGERTRRVEVSPLTGRLQLGTTT